jgi:glycosyltransferase involved in cell wall biosynthesis
LSYQGGGERWILEVAKRLSERGHRVNVLTTCWNPSGQNNVSTIFEDINVVETRYVCFFRGFAVPSPLDLRLFVKAFNESDVVYFYVYPPNELLAWALRHKIRSPLIGGFHTFLAPNRFFLHHIYQPFFKKALCTFDGLHVLNSYIANKLKDWGYTNICFIPNGVDTKIFKLREPSNTGFFKVLYAGRLTEDKGADILLGIIRCVNEELRILNIKFTICGFGPFKKFVEEATRKYANVEYLGFVSSEMLPKIYGEADLFLIPSKSEGMPLRLLEAQSCGLPAVGSRIPGISDVIVGGRTGQLVSIGDVEGFANAIKAYYELWLNSPDKYYELNKAIRAYIVGNYDWNIIMDKIEEMFRKCTNRNDAEKA